MGEVFCFKGKARLCCTLLVRWDEDHKEPWFIVTDLSVRAADAAWYGMRGGGWRWHCSKMTDPERAEWPHVPENGRHLPFG